jgi:hypothetical protein
MIYEGANGIQALDLVGRKLPKDGGRAVMAFFGEVQGFINAHKGNDAMKPYVEPLNVSLGHLQQATMWFMNNAMKNPDNAGAGASDYMHMFGLVALGLMWGRIALAVNEKLAAGDAGASGDTGGSGLDAQALKNKLIAGRFFAEKMLPETGAQLKRIEAGAGSVMEMAMEGF